MAKTAKLSPAPTPLETNLSLITKTKTSSFPAVQEAGTERNLQKQMLSFPIISGTKLRDNQEGKGTDFLGSNSDDDTDTHPPLSSTPPFLLINGTEIQYQSAQ